MEIVIPVVSDGRTDSFVLSVWKLALAGLGFLSLNALMYYVFMCAYSIPVCASCFSKETGVDGKKGVEGSIQTNKSAENKFELEPPVVR